MYAARCQHHHLQARCSTAAPCRSIARRAVTSSSSGSNVTSTTCSPNFEALLDWADASGVRPLPVRVEQHPEYGRCLVASEDIPNGTVLLSVPLEQVFQSQAFDDLEMHWAADMALRLLQARHASRQDNSNHSSSSSNSSAAYWAPWVNALPQQVVTPVEFTTQEVQQLVLPSTVEAVMNARESLEGCFEVLQPQLEAIAATWEDFLWAVQALHSRCFYEATAGRHMAVPGVDMCNHSYEPNATVRLVHSPAACQGLDALEEVAPVAAAAVCPSYFQLIADTSVRHLPQASTKSSDALRLLMRPNGIKAGEQVTISYGPWPSEPLLLLFGFVPQHNPHDSLVVFSDLQDMARCCLELARSSCHNQRGSVGGAGVASGLTAAAGVIGDPQFEQLLLSHLQAAEDAYEEQQQQQQQTHGPEQQAGGPPGFRDLTMYASSAADVRLQVGLQLLAGAIAAAVEQWCSSNTSALEAGQLPKQQQQQQHGAEQRMQQQEQCCAELLAVLPAVVPYRLKQLAQELEASVAALEGDDSRHSEPADSVQEGISYQPTASHRSLIMAYCSSKAKLAAKLLQRV